MRHTVVAFHGDIAGPQDLRQDMGDPRWVDRYMTYRRTDGQYIDWLRSQASVVLCGYSRGGQVVASLTRLLDNIAGCVVYESPVDVLPVGTAPALIIWNRRSPYRNTRGAQKSREAWKAGGRPTEPLWGKHRHTKAIWRPRTLFRGHGWDVSLNGKISDWIRELPSPTLEPATAAE